MGMKMSYNTLSFDLQKILVSNEIDANKTQHTLYQPTSYCRSLPTLIPCQSPSLLELLLQLGCCTIIKIIRRTRPLSSGHSTALRCVDEPDAWQNEDALLQLVSSLCEFRHQPTDNFSEPVRGGLKCDAF